MSKEKKSTILKISFEYCSLQYLNQWLVNDKGYCDALSGNDEEKKLSALKNAATFYRIARTLPLKYDEERGLGRLEPVLDILDGIKPNNFQNSSPNNEKVINEIEKIASEISEQYGNAKKMLSATTKFLWLKLKQPILIYDSRARNALEEKGKPLDNYYKYYEKWRKEFEVHKKQVEDACVELSNHHLYAIVQTAGIKKYIKGVSAEPWFHERVFDIYLWNKGKDN